MTPRPELRASQASCSFHLRQLAKFGFVREVEGVCSPNGAMTRVPGQRAQWP
ncbi:MAG: hypothetical protein M0T77_07960 [Actinomycetota bacterium]|nr:hypothetical protein [Actinomycetota bacterium]